MFCVSLSYVNSLSINGMFYQACLVDKLCPIEITSLSELLNDFRPKLPPEVFVILCLALEWSYKHIEAINYFSP